MKQTARRCKLNQPEQDESLFINGEGASLHPMC
jgi:hypothetical protein